MNLKLVAPSLFDPSVKLTDLYKPINRNEQSQSIGTLPLSNEVWNDLTIADAFIRYLEKMDVKFVFGIPGGFIAPFLKLLRRSRKISFIIGRQETGCAFMADGFSRVSGKIGVVFVTAGPGALNALTGVACAHKGNSSVLLVSGQSSASHFGMGALQASASDGVDVVEIFKHTCAFSERVLNAEAFRSCLLQASRLCLGSPRQAAHLSFPLDVSAATVQQLSVPESKTAYSLTSIAPDEKKISQALHFLLQANNPLLFIGSGCREALREQPERLAGLEELVTSLGLPLVTSLQAKGLFPENHPLSLGVYGACGSRQAQSFVGREAPDVVLVIGSSLGEWATNNWDKSWVPQKLLIQIDVNPATIGKVFPVQLGIVGDAGQSIDLLLQYRRKLLPDSPIDLDRFRARKSRILCLKKDESPFGRPERRNLNSIPLLPQHLMKELNELISPQTSLFLDNGNSTAWGIHHLLIDPPAEVFLSTTMSSMGWANGAVIGAKLGSSERTCICLTGDGSFLMNGNEVSTAARYKIGAIWIILYDNSLGMVNHGEKVTGNDEFPIEDPYYELGNPDIVKFAQSLGADGYWIEKEGDLQAIYPTVLEGANRRNRPQVIAVRIDPREPAPNLDRFEALKKEGA